VTPNPYNDSIRSHSDYGRNRSGITLKIYDIGVYFSLSAAGFRSVDAKQRNRRRSTGSILYTDRRMSL